MEKYDFSLIPFNLKDAPKIKIIGSIARKKERFKIEYLLSGDLTKILIPKVHATPSRQYELWEHTCFEFFLRLPNTTKYWEFNLASTGNWNVYRFLNYRTNITEETAFEVLNFNSSLTDENFKIALDINLDKIAIANRDLDIAITTVIEDQNQKLSYWALTHPATTPDFHHPDSFTIASLRN